MATIDIFNSDAFSATEMTKALDKLGYVPGLLGSIPGLFEEVGVRTTEVWIEGRGEEPALIQTDERGEPPHQVGGGSRTARSFKTRRLSQSSRVTADSLQNIRAFGSESELATVQEEIAYRQRKLRRNIELTIENMRLGCAQGLVTDADGSTLYDWATEFGQTIPAEVDFDLDNASPASGAVRKKCNEVTRSILRGLKGLGGNAVRVYGLCGDAFWDDLTAHSEVRQTYLNTTQAADLREGNAWEFFGYGGITWVNYRGTDDGSTVAINTDKARFFPAGAGIFQIAYAPAETFDFVNTRGRPVYSWVEPDPAVNKRWADVQMFSYPLPVCTMPQALHRAKRT